MLNKIKTKLQDAYSWVRHYCVRRPYRKISRVIAYIPVAWKAEDWDYRYSLDVFKFQLERQIKWFESDRAMTMSAPERAKEIKTFVKLLEKVYEKDYAIQYLTDIEEIFGKEALDFEFIPTDETGKYFEMKYKYEIEPRYELVRDEISKMKDEGFKTSHAKQDKAHRILWKYLEHHISSWWD